MVISLTFLGNSLAFLVVIKIIFVIYCCGKIISLTLAVQLLFYIYTQKFFNSIQMP